MPQPSPNAKVPDATDGSGSEEEFRGGSLRGLVWALLLECAAVALAACFLVAWRLLR
jgi:hypothetical protein